MQPLINLKQFLAVLLLLIIPAVLLTAYFRNYQPETGGAGHQHADAAGTHPADGHGEAAKPQGEGGGEQGKMSGGMDHSKMTGGGDAKQPPAGGQMDHEKMKEGAAPQGTAETPDAKQLEASRAQLEASRAQLEASRQALEAAKGTPAPPKGEQPEADKKPVEPMPADATKKPDAAKPAGAADGHTHQH